MEEIVLTDEEPALGILIPGRLAVSGKNNQIFRSTDHSAVHPGGSCWAGEDMSEETGKKEKTERCGEGRGFGQKSIHIRRATRRGRYPCHHPPPRPLSPSSSLPVRLSVDLRGAFTSPSSIVLIVLRGGPHCTSLLGALGYKTMMSSISCVYARAPSALLRRCSDPRAADLQSPP